MNFNSKMTKSEVLNLSSITLAFIGDAVYSLFVRQSLVFEKEEKGDVLNKKASKIVSAVEQAERVEKLIEIFNEEELAVYKRGRNVKKTSKAKHTSYYNYNKSTGFEAVIGYLYLIGEEERLNYILNYKDEE